MKKYIFLLVSSVILIQSCSLLDLNPEDRVTPDTFFTNELDMELFTNSFYVSCLPSAADIYQDEADGIINPQLAAKISGQRIIPETSSGIDGWNWEALRQINYFLENSYRCEDQEVREHYEGVARFFRALFYFHKVRSFGDVPWYDYVVGSGDKAALNKPRDPRSLVVKNIIADLDWAAAHLRTEKNLYRVTKWTALALKSRVCLFEGTFLKYHGLQGNEWEWYLRECVKASEDFMNNSGYTIASGGANSYKKLFTDVQDPNSTEIILLRDYDQSLGLQHKVQTYVVSAGSGCAGVTKRIADSYLMANGTRYTDQANYQNNTFVQECTGRDPRFAQTFRTPGGAVPDLTVAKLGYQLTKFYKSKDYDNASDVDMPIFRTAEVYLNLAEAKAELGTLTQSDLNNTVNRIRARVGMTAGLDMTAANNNPDPWLAAEKFGYPNVDSGANKGVILEIRRERGVELIMEGFRYYDLMRWREGVAFEQPFLGMRVPGYEEYITSGGTSFGCDFDIDGNGTADFFLYEGIPDITPTAKTKLEIGEKIHISNDGYLIMHPDLVRTWNDAKDYLNPIPTKERILTQGALTQNPGWNDGLVF